MKLKFWHYLAIAILFYSIFFILYLLVSELYFAALCYVLGCVITTLVYWLFNLDKEDFPLYCIRKNKYSSCHDYRLIRSMGKHDKLRRKCKIHENEGRTMEYERDYCVPKDILCINSEKQKDIDSKELGPNQPPQLDSFLYENEKKTNIVKPQNTSDITSNENIKKNKSGSKKSSSKSRKIGRKKKVKKHNKKTEANMKKDDYPVRSIKHSM